LGLSTGEETEGTKRLHNEEIHNLLPSLGLSSNARGTVQLEITESRATYMTL